MAKKGATARLASNRRRLRLLTAALATAVALYVARLVLRPWSGRHLAALAVGGGVGGLALAALARAAAPVYIGGALEDGGADITAPGGAPSSLHDAIYVAAAALAGGAATDRALLLLAAFPLYVGHMFVSGVLRPALAAIFASTPEEDEAHAREVARRERARAKAERTARGKMARRA